MAVLADLLASGDSKGFCGSGTVKDGKASDLLGVQELLSSDASFGEEQFETSVRAILSAGLSSKDKKSAAAAARLQELFDAKWKSAKSKAKPMTREIADKDKRSLVERLTELAPRQLVEALHVAKQAQPDLDLGLAPDLITLSVDDMTHECLVALIAFCGK